SSIAQRTDSVTLRADQIALNGDAVEHVDADAEEDISGDDVARRGRDSSDGVAVAVQEIDPPAVGDGQGAGDVRADEVAFDHLGIADIQNDTLRGEDVDL